MTKPPPPPPKEHVCAHCGAHAFLGIGVPGRRSEVPRHLRGYVWHCGAAACASAILDRRDAAMVKAGMKVPPRRPDDPRGPATPAADPLPPAAAPQASLL